MTTIPIRSFVPNAVTAMALCVGFSGVWYALSQNWVGAAACIVVAGILDGLDGRIARMLNGQSRFGAELDSLSDVICFGVTPAVLVFSWSLQNMERFGWTICLFFTLCMALRLARFNAQIDSDPQPHKIAGYLTGVPAPSAAGMALMPIAIWIETGAEWIREPYLIGPWMLIICVLVISNVATFSWKSLRIRHSWRFIAIALCGPFVGALIVAPWPTLALTAAIYFMLIPFSMWRYHRIKKRQKSLNKES